MRMSDWSSYVCSSDLPRVGDRDDVVLKGGALVRRVRRAQEQGARGVEPVAPRGRLRRVEMLARRKAPAADAIDEDLDPRRVVPVAQPHMVRRPPVAEGRGNGTVPRKGGIGEGEIGRASCRESECQYGEI